MFIIIFLGLFWPFWSCASCPTEDIVCQNIRRGFNLQDCDGNPTCLAVEQGLLNKSCTTVSANQTDLQLCQSLKFIFYLEGKKCPDEDDDCLGLAKTWIHGENFPCSKSSSFRRSLCLAVKDLSKLFDFSSQFNIDRHLLECSMSYHNQSQLPLSMYELQLFYDLLNNITLDCPMGDDTFSKAMQFYQNEISKLSGHHRFRLIKFTESSYSDGIQETTGIVSPSGIRWTDNFKYNLVDRNGRKVAATNHATRQAIGIMIKRHTISRKFAEMVLQSARKIDPLRITLSTIDEGFTTLCSSKHSGLQIDDFAEPALLNSTARLVSGQTFSPLKRWPLPWEADLPEFVKDNRDDSSYTWELSRVARMEKFANVWQYNIVILAYSLRQEIKDKGLDVDKCYLYIHSTVDKITERYNQLFGSDCIVNKDKKPIIRSDDAPERHILFKVPIRKFFKQYL